MAYIAPDKNNPIAVKFWDVFLNCLENTLKMNNLLDNFNINIDSDTYFKYNKILIDNPFRIRLSGCIDPNERNIKGFIVHIELKISNNSIYLTVHNSWDLLFKKRGQAFKNEDVNIELIKEVCGNITAKFDMVYRRIKERDDKEKARAVLLNQNLEKVNSEFADNTLEIKGTTVKFKNTFNNDWQVYAYEPHSEDEKSFASIKLEKVSLEKMAKIAKILAEPE